MAACGGQDSAHRQIGRSGEGPIHSMPSRPTGPPQAFESLTSLEITSPGKTLPEELALGTDLVYQHASKFSDGGTGGIVAFRLSDGKEVWRVPVPDMVTLFTTGRTTPRISGRAVVSAFPISTRGEGTLAGRYSIRVAAYDAATGGQIWATEVAKGNGSYQDTDLGLPDVVGADDQHVLVTTGEHDEDIVSALIDVRNGAVIWEDQGLRAIDLEPHTVVGMRGRRVVGKSTTDGRQLWQRQVSLVMPSPDPGPGLTHVAGTPEGGRPLEVASLFLDPATGRIKLTLDGPSHECLYDRQSTAVCSGSGIVAAIDLATARRLWQLPDKAANRKAPTVTAAWRGVVYGEAIDPVVLDARSGKDINTHIGSAPTLVNDQYGLTFDEFSDQVRISRAVG
ncbi:PQQ-binding-like beta-propeller repeat protein [Actinomadura sp. 6N118]|uniref:outer membrane protein assembly factor BamB family protein n=1 Tax=Actinomadura sp. 6N118 TaxID=3375151 RepID=UPI0037B7FD56